jgi:hypothetical protein
MNKQQLYFVETMKKSSEERSAINYEAPKNNVYGKYDDVTNYVDIIIIFTG